MRPTTTIERDFIADPDKLWSALTTKHGIEAWRGPEGFEVRVRELELRPGGAFVYETVAVGVAEIALMASHDLPLASTTIAKVEVAVPLETLEIVTRVDHIPGIEPYEQSSVYEIRENGGGTHLTLTIEAMHDDRWTELSIVCHQDELDQLAKALAR